MCSNRVVNNAFGRLIEHLPTYLPTYLGTSQVRENSLLYMHPQRVAHMNKGNFQVASVHIRPSEMVRIAYGRRMKGQFFRRVSGTRIRSRIDSCLCKYCVTQDSFHIWNNRLEWGHKTWPLVKYRTLLLHGWNFLPVKRTLISPIPRIGRRSAPSTSLQVSLQSKFALWDPRLILWCISISNLFESCFGRINQTHSQHA